MSIIQSKSQLIDYFNKGIKKEDQLLIGVEHETWITSAYLAPAALCGVFVGHQISKKINEMLFKVFILIILIITGCMMLINL